MMQERMRMIRNSLERERYQLFLREPLQRAERCFFRSGEGCRFIAHGTQNTGKKKMRALRKKRAVTQRRRCA
jgi:hypothetical protein